MPAEPRPSWSRALVVGATGELGAALCRQLADEGVDVVAAGRDVVALERLRADGSASAVAQVDLARPDAAAALVEAEACDLLIMAVAGTTFSDLADRDWASITAEIDAQLVAVLRITLAAAKRMRAAGGGTILLIGSTAQFRPAPRLALYAATKSFLASLSTSLTAELQGNGVIVTCCITGPFGTSFDSKLERKPRIKVKSARVIARGALAVARSGRPLGYAGPGARLRSMAFGALPWSVMRRLLPTRKRRG